MQIVEFDHLCHFLAHLFLKLVTEHVFHFLLIVVLGKLQLDGVLHFSVLI